MASINTSNTRLNIAGVTDIGGKSPGIAAKESKFAAMFPITTKLFVEIIGNLFGQRYSVVSLSKQ